MTRSSRRRFPRPLLFVVGVVLAAGSLLVGSAVVGWYFVVAPAIQVPDLEVARTATTAVAPASAAEGELTVRLDASARPVVGNAPDHLDVQLVVDLDASDIRGPVFVTLEAIGTESGPIEPAGDVGDTGGGSAGDQVLIAWSTATATSVQEVVHPGSGRLGLGSVQVVLPCPLGEACTARWRYRIEPLGGDPVGATVVWAVDASAVYSSGDRTRRPPEGATIEVAIGDAESVAPAPEPVVLEAAGLADGAIITTSGPDGSAGVVRATLLDGANGSASDFSLSPAEGQTAGSVVTVGPSIWEAPLAAGSCDDSGCTVRLSVTGSPPPGSTLRIDARADASLGAPSIGDQMVVAVE